MAVSAQQRRRSAVGLGPGPTAVYLVVLGITASNFVVPGDAPLAWWVPVTSAAVFLAGQFLRPLRFAPPYISPKNVALTLTGIQLVVFPTLLQFGFGYLGQLPVMPDGPALTFAIWCQVLAYVGIGAGLALMHSPNAAVAAHVSPPDRVRLLIALGLFGFAIRYNSPGEVVAYFRGQRSQDALVAAGQSASLLVAVSTFLLPCLGFGLAMSSLNAIRRAGNKLTPYAVGAGLLAVASTALFSYNRASVIVPMIVFAAVYTTHIRPLTRGRAIAFAFIVIAAATLLTDLRSESARETIRSVGGDVSQFDGYGLGLDELQLYGAAPQFIAIVNDVDAPSGRASVLLDAALSPVPVLGGESRLFNGTRTYNAAIYGVNGPVDQALPALVEFRWDLGLPGVLIGYLLIGLGVGYCQRRFVAAPNLGAAFVWTFFGCWLSAGLILQVETMSQIFVYWSIPAVLFMRRSRRRADDDPAKRASRVEAVTPGAGRPRTS